MSEQAYLVVGVVSTFITTVLVGIRFGVSRQSKRATAVLVGGLESAGIDLPARRSDGSFTDRLLAPAASKLSALVSRYTPVGMRNDIAKKLVMAGNPRGVTAEFFLALRVVLVVAGVALGYYIGVERGLFLLGPLWVPFGAWAGYLAPAHWLDGRVSTRQEAIRRDLPDLTDLLTISVEAGLAFDAALLNARRAMKGPLAEEIGRLLHEMQLGAPRVEALRNLSERTDVEELRGFVLAMVQADTFGVSIANVLRSQSHELRTKRRQRAEEKAMKTPVKLLFPMICCIMPALLVVIIGPGVIRISHMFGPTP